MEGCPRAVERHAVRLENAFARQPRAHGEEVGHQLDVVDHHARGPEDLVAAREEAAADFAQQRAEWRGQRPPERFVQTPATGETVETGSRRVGLRC